MQRRARIMSVVGGMRAVQVPPRSSQKLATKSTCGASPPFFGLCLLR
jgi:hypothetical protein